MVELTQVFTLVWCLRSLYGPISNSQVVLQFAWNRRATSFYATHQLACGRFTWRRRPAMALCNRALSYKVCRKLRITDSVHHISPCVCPYICLQFLYLTIFHSPFEIFPTAYTQALGCCLDLIKISG